MTQLNFNKKENQDRCIFRPINNYGEKISYGGLPLAYFIYNRNYGWTRYKGITYNLNKDDQADAFLQVLKEEGFLLERDRIYTICDRKFENFVNVSRHYLLYFLYDMKGNPLNIEECESIDITVRENQ